MKRKNRRTHSHTHTRTGSHTHTQAHTHTHWAHLHQHIRLSLLSSNLSKLFGFFLQSAREANGRRRHDRWKQIKVQHTHCRESRIKEQGTGRGRGGRWGGGEQNGIDNCRPAGTLPFKLEKCSRWKCLQTAPIVTFVQTVWQVKCYSVVSSFRDTKKKGQKFRDRRQSGWMQQRRHGHFPLGESKNFVPKIRATAFWTILRLVDIL